MFVTLSPIATRLCSSKLSEVSKIIDEQESRISFSLAIFQAPLIIRFRADQQSTLSRKQ
jgi:hypothetical protein